MIFFPSFIAALVALIIWLVGAASFSGWWILAIFPGIWIAWWLLVVVFAFVALLVATFFERRL